MLQGRPKKYTHSEIAKVLELYTEYGPRKTEQMLQGTDTPVSASTISRWAKERGRVTHSVQNTDAARLASIASRKKNAEETKLIMVERLSTIAELSAERQIEILQTNNVTLKDAVASGTRAIHDLRLLIGESTETTNSNVSDIDVINLQKKLEIRNAYNNAHDWNRDTTESTGTPSHSLGDLSNAG
jgi:hypothetical protein